MGGREKMFARKGKGGRKGLNECNGRRKGLNECNGGGGGGGGDEMKFLSRPRMEIKVEINK